MSQLKQFENHQYLNLETFRKSGLGVKTPVWFAQDGETLYVWTEGKSGKAKRIRRNGAVKIAPCKADGALLGEWMDAHAIVNDSPEAVNHVKALFSKKYGFAFHIFGLLGKLRRAKYVSVAIQARGG